MDFLRKCLSRIFCWHSWVHDGYLPAIRVIRMKCHRCGRYKFVGTAKGDIYDSP